MSRIISGTLRGRRLAVPQSGTRPTSDRVKEALFSRLEHHDLLEDATVLDLYAGSGGLAFESLSRGAARAVLVDVSAGAVRTCRDNAATLGVKRLIEVHQLKAEQYLGRLTPAQSATAQGKSDQDESALAAPDQAETGTAEGEGLFDLVFLDPPYALNSADLGKVLELLGLAGMLSEHGAIVLERDRRSPAVQLPHGLVSFDERKYGDSAVWLLERA